MNISNLWAIRISMIHHIGNLSRNVLRVQRDLFEALHESSLPEGGALDNLKVLYVGVIVHVYPKQLEKPINQLSVLREYHM